MQELEKILEEIDNATDEYGMVDYINDEPVISKNQAKEIIRKHMNDGWTLVERELPPNAKHKGAFCPKVRVMTKFGETCGWYNPDCESWYILVWFMTERYLDSDIDFERGDKPKIVRLPDEVNDTKHILVAWQPLPEPYHPERRDAVERESNNL